MKKKEVSIKFYFIIFIILFFGLWFSVGAYHHYKKLPSWVSYESQEYNVSDKDIEFIYDLTYLSNSENRVFDHHLFEKVFEMINQSEKFIVIDMFLFNSNGDLTDQHLNLSTDLKNALIEKKKFNPGLEVVFITDEINNFYGSYFMKDLKEMQDSGINVVITNTEFLRDSNPIYSGFWRAYLNWFGVSGFNWISHPLRGDEKVNLRSILKMINAKANHRKVVISDNGDQIWTLVLSANPHDGSSLHSNVGVLIKKHLWKDALESEKNVAIFSKDEFIEIPEIEEESSGDIKVSLITERKIKENVLDEIKNAEEIYLGMFYLSDRDVVNALIDASNSGANVKIILDQNKDAFGRSKNGVPNQPVAEEIFAKSNASIRWYNTQGEQYHSKIILIKRKDGSIVVILGSANFTKRNLENFNLEKNVKVVSPKNSLFALSVQSYFNRIWNNVGGNYTLDYSSNRDKVLYKKLQYRIQEFTGLSSF